jgi:hypothetical protein
MLLYIANKWEEVTSMKSKLSMFEHEFYSSYTEELSLIQHT